MNKIPKEHHSNYSQLHIYTSACSLKEKKRLRASLEMQNTNAKSCKNSKVRESQTIRSLISKSTRKVNKKRVLVENIEDSSNNCKSDDFFCFGKGLMPQKVRLPVPEMDQIMEVPDTGSYSQRNSDQNKQNLRDLVNRQVQFLKTDQFFRPNLAKKPPLHPQNTMTISLMSQRQKKNRNFQIQQIQSKSCSQSNSTMSFSKHKINKNKSKSKSRTSQLQHKQQSELTILREKTKLMQQNCLLVWQCMSQILQKNEAIKHNSEQNTRKINDLLKRDQQREAQLLEMKLQLMRKEKKPLRS